MKSLALRLLPEETFLVEPSLLSLAIHKNFGLAFDLPFRLEFVVLASILIGGMLLRTAWKTRMDHPEISCACLIISVGALGNLFDRIVYGFTVDYIILFGRSAINFSDLVIIVGVISLLLLSSKRSHIDIRPVS